LVRIAERVWPAWREAAAQWDEPSLLVLFSPTGDRDDAAAALREVVLEVQDAFDAEFARSGMVDPPLTGEWNWVRVPDGVLVQVVECDILEDVLPAVAAALERRGVEGEFDLRERPTAATPPITAHMLECRVRVRGERLRREERTYRWQADPAAHEAILAAGERWCRQRGASANQSLSVSTVPPVPVEPDEEVLGRMLDEVVHGMHVAVSAVTADEFRSVMARPHAGGVSLVVGGAWLEAGEWPLALAELTGLLRVHADFLAYGYIRRGWAVQDALLDPSLPYDWPRRPDYEPRGIGFAREAFEDVYAPDAFGVQLLGSGYAGRVPEVPTWQAERVGEAPTLLEHADLPAWFDEPFVPFRQRVAYAEAPEVLARARVELAPILYTPGVLKQGGYAEDLD
jgi:hypothetical protein